MDGDLVKRCARCNRELPLSEFGTYQQHGHLYPRSYCHKCTSAYNRELYAAKHPKRYVNRCSAPYDLDTLRYLPADDVLAYAPGWLLQDALGLAHATVSLMKNDPHTPRLDMEELWGDRAIRKVRQYMDALLDKGVSELTRMRPKVGVS